jgi:hypothetical protein
MIFKQYKDGSCDIEFSENEINIILKNKKLHLSDESLRHFGNHLMKIIIDWQVKFKEELVNQQTFTDTKIEGK